MSRSEWLKVLQKHLRAMILDRHVPSVCGNREVLESDDTMADAVRLFSSWSCFFAEEKGLETGSGTTSKSVEEHRHITFWQRVPIMNNHHNENTCTVTTPCRFLLTALRTFYQRAYKSRGTLPNHVKSLEEDEVVDGWWLFNELSVNKMTKSLWYQSRDGKFWNNARRDLTIPISIFNDRDFQTSSYCMAKASASAESQSIERVLMFRSMIPQIQINNSEHFWNEKHATLQWRLKRSCLGIRRRGCLLLS